MTKTEEILSITQEECAEVIQAIAKIDRFGTDGTHKGLDGDNTTRLESELGDLLAMVDLLIEHNVVDSNSIDAAKLLKIAKLHKWSNIFNEGP